jgi:hypothetical protein
VQTIEIAKEIIWKIKEQIEAGDFWDVADSLKL